MGERGPSETQKKMPIVAEAMRDWMGEGVW